MYDKHTATWRCRSCGYDNDLDCPSCVYCGELNHADLSAFDDVLPDDEDLEELEP